MLDKAAALLLVLLAATWASPGDAPEPALRLGFTPGPRASAVEAAVRGAYRRLKSPRCAAVFSDFADPQGRPLQESLDALGQNGAGYLGLLRFEDGSLTPQCRKHAKVLAFTQRGSRVVFLCSEPFAERQLHDPSFAEVVVIHEALHAAGLAENPPTPSEITGKVLGRCGSR